MIDDQLWWRGASIYQIYPRSFADSNGDGVGDLNGITARLGYVATLGVDAIWLSPFFPSPMADFGYDVADFCNVDPIFGDLADFDALLARAHDLGLKLLIDQVYAHSSDQHPWFIESRGDRTNARADWYVWADAKVDGTPPSNWQSVFGGPAWTWDARRGQYYLHNFLAQQPQLNLHNRAVQDASLDVARFWLDRGVDGFRIDAINFAMHDPQLRDNPPAQPTHQPRTRPFDFQRQIFNQGHPELPDFLERLRALTDSYGGRFTVAEVACEDPDCQMKAYIAGDHRLNSAYGFDFLYAAQLTPELVAGALQRWPGGEGARWPCWAFENHDAPRAVSRWADRRHSEAFCRMKAMLLVCLRGNIFIYQGEELGLSQVDIGFDDLRDPEAIANWPLTLGRDGARTPMPWENCAAHLGFSTAKPWLPLGRDHGMRAVDLQAADPKSLLNHMRHMLALRRRWPALALGSVTLLQVTPTLLAFVRSDASTALHCVFNLTDKSLEWNSPKELTIGESVNGATLDHLPPYGALIAR